MKRLSLSIPCQFEGPESVTTNSGYLNQVRVIYEIQGLRRQTTVYYWDKQQKPTIYDDNIIVIKK